MAKNIKTSPGERQSKKTRSRLGCKNCKLRSVKCDERKPNCKRCLDYGVVCSYVTQTTPGTMRFASEQEFIMEDSPGSKDSLIDEILDFKIPQYISYWPTKTDELINKFQVLTAHTISAGPRTDLYRSDVVARARQYPFMLNTIMALTAMHFRSLCAGMKSHPPPEELEYCCSAVSMFAKEVVKPRDAEHQGVLLVAAAMIYNMTFASIEAKRPEEAWPLAPPDPKDLGWIKVSAAKRQIMQLTQPMGDDKLFSMLSSSFPPEIAAREANVPPATLPLGFVSLFSLESANRENNPYFLPAVHLTRILDSSNTVFVALGWIQVINEISSEYKQLLYEKDPRALLLLACWFAKLSQVPVWWIRPRAIIEGQAICLYLDRYHADDMSLQVLLRFPKGIFANLPG